MLLANGKYQVDSLASVRAGVGYVTACVWNPSPEHVKGDGKYPAFSPSLPPPKLFYSSQYLLLKVLIWIRIKIVLVRTIPFSL